MQILNRQEQLKRQLAEQRVVDRHHGRMEDLGATAEETLSNGAVIGGVPHGSENPRNGASKSWENHPTYPTYLTKMALDGSYILIQLFKFSVVCGPPDL